MRKVLIIDDERAVLNFLYVMLAQTEKYETDTLNDPNGAFKLLKAEPFDLLILDMDMPDVTGLDILNFIKENKIDIETIVLTGVDDVELAVSAMKSGAYDYLKKPVDNDLLLLTMDRALERKSMREELAQLKQGGWETVKQKEAFDGIITSDSRMINIFHLIERIAPTDTGVLILGESGTGKELIARAIHKASNRANNSFIAVNAGVFAQELFASEFFGHIKGAFSGAHSDKRGFLEEANKGTLFLDEIGELQLEAQVKLLRVLQDGSFFRVGSTKIIHADVRLVAATNKNLWEEIEKGNFRKDLFYRLNVNTISLPPLRERKGDVPFLVQYFFERYVKAQNKDINAVSDDVMELLSEYNFPGNIRELENIVYSSVLIEQSKNLTISSLPEGLTDKLKSKKRRGRKEETSNNEVLGNLDIGVITLEDLEKHHIKRILEKAEGNRSVAAKMLGISRVTLIAKIKKYDLE
jgi:DNA-binding NtrC family response regulator